MIRDRRIATAFGGDFEAQALTPVSAATATEPRPWQSSAPWQGVIALGECMVELSLAGPTAAALGYAGDT